MYGAQTKMTMKTVGHITKGVTIIIDIVHGLVYSERSKAITHRLYYDGDKIGDVRVVLALEES